ncbi:atrial natriuretic peptide receptor 1-like isoform X2 [Paramacrobiotus metropolitanus]|uniref:atrial natriuretic peptide receptor 1-like isoform X2 n=1 Tax=Paramacrobiotus metropolitanus TaxID=2943436 RepID=UPI00244659DD|nr:atrial natriuretic peptide receptor 1-like isoform X2 [Paramacrobiotus metropolitanus]
MFFFIFLSLWQHASARLNIVTLTATRNWGSGAEQMISTFEIAAEHMAEKYPVLYANYTKTDLMWELNGPNICKAEGDWLVPIRLAEWYGANKFSDENGVTIIATSVCNWALPDVFDFARELDLMIVPWQRSPNSVAMAAASYIIFGAAIGKIMDKYNWRYLAIISDNLTRLQEAGRSISECDGMFIDLRKRAMEIQQKVFAVDSTDPGFSFKNSLQEAAEYSRIIMCCTLFESMRKLLADAYDLGMTNGDFVFMMLYEGEIPKEPPIDDWNKEGEHDVNEKVYQALDNVLNFRTPHADWKRFNETSWKVNKRREAKFGTPFNESLIVNDFIFQCHEAIEMASLAINETLMDMNITTTEALGRHLPVADMIRRISNRTHELMFENVTVTPASDKEPIIWIQQFDRAVNQAVTVLHYDYRTESYPLVDPNRPVKWRLGHVPPDRPPCGLHGEKCISGLSIGLIVGVVTAVVLLTVVGLVAFTIWNGQRKTNIKQTWWIVHPTDVEQAGSILKASTGKTSMSQISASTRQGGENFQRRVVMVRGVQAVKTPLWWNAHGHKQPSVNSAFINFLNSIRKLDAPQINKLLGLDITELPPALYYEWCKRGSLEDLLQAQDPDWTLKLSLLQDMIQGLRYIHTSGIRLHGNLRPTKCLLDSQLSLKISDYGHQIISRLLSGSTLQAIQDSRPFFPLHSWMAPEVMRGQTVLQASDVYAMGIIVQQILMGYQSFNAYAFGSTEDLLADDADYTPPRPEFSEVLRNGSLSAFITIIQRCWQEDPTARPTMLDVQKVFAAVTVSEGLKGTLIERVLKRLEKYNAILEKQVFEKTVQLQLEQQRADDLLREMLPEEIVRKLRSGITPDPEYVDEVSVLFSDITGFTDFIAGCPPDEALHFLHNTYTHFDKVIAHVSVYKLETIGSSYVAVSGLVERIGSRHAHEICRLAVLLREEFYRVIDDSRLGLLVGLHSGPVAVGVVGLKRPRYCLFGDTVNTASRMESNGLPGKIHVSPDVVPIAEQFGHNFEIRGKMEIKGKGQITTYWLND